MLSKGHVSTIKRVRAILRAVEAKCGGETRYPHGKLAEACHAADQALLNVILIARHHFDADHITDADLRVPREEIR